MALLSVFLLLENTPFLLLQTHRKYNSLFLLKIFSYVKSTQARLVELIFTSSVLPCRFVQMSTVAFIILKFKHSYLYF